MLVGERMKRPVITIKPEMPIIEALDLMRKEHIRRAPVVKDGKLIGIVSEKDPKRIRRLRRELGTLAINTGEN